MGQKLCVNIIFTWSYSLEDTNFTKRLNMQGPNTRKIIMVTIRMSKSASKGIKDLRMIFSVHLPGFFSKMYIFFSHIWMFSSTIPGVYWHKTTFLFKAQVPPSAVRMSRALLFCNVISARKLRGFCCASEILTGLPWFWIMIDTFQMDCSSREIPTNRKRPEYGVAYSPMREWDCQWPGFRNSL